MKKSRLKQLLFSVLFLASLSIFGQGNLLKNSSFDNEDLSEYQVLGVKDVRLFSVFTEDLTWNKCGKIDLIKYSDTKTGKGLLTGLAIGGAKGANGADGRKAFRVKPNTAYSFSMELKGTVSGAYITAYSWSGDCKGLKERTKLETSTKRVKVTKEWQVYKGTFTTPGDAKRAILYMTVYTNARYGITEKPGTYILIDNVSVKEKKKWFTAPGESLGSVPAKQGALAKFTSDSVTVDGKFDELFWKDAESMTDFKQISNEVTAKIQTSQNRGDCKRAGGCCYLQ